ncbi:Protoglobin-domain-containing protein [Annulohypoxylon maeteangense]|uniref:Protoglobin-domain-containing protein n=1 Tax=Annulohypoxylon maeteangense TaxID=1927788 RepID=UPI002007A6D3|nr:Protoglobin-domain-containing protein [Annulohypoxylon maeteangense]KAI0880242.1 Protoglobin-domain-containing protein [Annulohypoxylon maeteangense]
MGPLARPRQHIDRKDLYTNLEARIQYLHSFIDFSSNDIEALMTGSKYIKQLIPAIVNIVYQKLLQYDITARALQTRSTSYDGPVDDNLDENSPQILHRKMFLRAYLAKLCSDPSTLEFWEYLDKVGMMHTGRGREHPLHVEYVHIGACLAFIQDTLTEALLSHPRLRMDKKIALVKAIGKVIWVQNDLFAKWYVRDGDEFAEEMEKQQVEPEGFLHGKKILDDIEEGLPSSPTCPFSGLSAVEKAEACTGCGDKGEKENGCTSSLPIRSHIETS